MARKRQNLAQIQPNLAARKATKAVTESANIDNNWPESVQHRPWHRQVWPPSPGSKGAAETPALLGREPLSSVFRRRLQRALPWSSASIPDMRDNVNRKRPRAKLMKEANVPHRAQHLTLSLACGFGELASPKPQTRSRDKPRLATLRFRHISSLSAVRCSPRNVHQRAVCLTCASNGHRCSAPLPWHATTRNAQIASFAHHMPATTG